MRLRLSAGGSCLLCQCLFNKSLTAVGPCNSGGQHGFSDGDCSADQLEDQPLWTNETASDADHTGLAAKQVMSGAHRHLCVL